MRQWWIRPSMSAVAMTSTPITTRFRPTVVRYLQATEPGPAATGDYRASWSGPPPNAERSACRAPSLRTIPPKQVSRKTGCAIPHVTVLRPALFLGIEPGTIERSRHREPDPIVAKRAGAGLRTRVAGILREIIRSRDPFRVFGHGRGTIGAGHA